MGDTNREVLPHDHDIALGKLPSTCVLHCLGCVHKYDSIHCNSLRHKIWKDDRIHRRSLTEPSLSVPV